MIQHLKAGGDQMQRVVARIVGSVLRMAFEPYGCRVVQLALEVASAADKDAIVSELHGHVREAMLSPHANFVIQKVVEALPVASVSFVAKELATHAAEAARHRFGCRILCRLV